MKYLNPDGFSVALGTKAYRDNWDATFGEKKEEPPHAEQLKECDGYYDDGIGSTACSNREGCGRPGCPANDFGYTP